MIAALCEKFVGYHLDVKPMDTATIEAAIPVLLARSIDRMR